MGGCVCVCACVGMCVCVHNQEIIKKVNYTAQGHM